MDKKATGVTKGPRNRFRMRHSVTRYRSMMAQEKKIIDS